MAAYSKKRPVEEEESSSSSSESEDFSDGGEEAVEDEELGENDKEIQVDFEGQNPCQEDFAGIKSLLHQLLLKAHVDTSQLADLIIEQSFIGSVLKQCWDEEMSESDDEDDSMEQVFGLTTVINLTHHKGTGCVKQLIEFIDAKTGGKLSKLMNSAGNELGVLINERFINIPPQVSVPLLDNLSNEMDEAKKKGEKFNFTHYVMISKFHEAMKAGPGAKKVKGANLLWVNAEEEAMLDLGETLGEYSVQSESDSAVSATWDEEDEQLEPKRRVTLFKASQWQDVISSVKVFLS